MPATKQRSAVTTSQGRFYPLGATPTAAGVNFALFSQHATAVSLLLFDAPGDAEPSIVIPVTSKVRHVWNVFVNGIAPGQLYGYKVDGPYDPARGHRFNRNRLLVDPYAKALAGKFRGSGKHFGYDHASPDMDCSFNEVDNTAFAPKSIVIDDAFEWNGDRRLDLPFQDLVIYEVHVKGFTAHPSSGVRDRGTFLGVIERIPYLKELGVNAVELLPVHECFVDDFLLGRGLTNYWGYNTIGFFAPDSRFASGSAPGAQVAQFKEMVRALHAAGIEVILDVVYNHTGEGNQEGPTLSFRGIDNANYYALQKENPRLYVDYTGCGNTLDFDNPNVLKMAMDSLRYWVEVMHVDGFRFDLASALGRNDGRFDKVSLFFSAIHQDPVLSRVKLIAEPWDITGDGYQVGNFPIDWAEWNGKYRDCLRKAVKSDEGTAPELASRLTGSADLYGWDGRTPYNSINFITCHDGFTLWDVVSYEKKHNEANGESNRDGANDNNSWSWGVEGETKDAAIVATRRKIVMNCAAALLLSQGIPMILGGDELGRTQRGNNNAYCQDNELSWYDWGLLKKNDEIFRFFKELIALRRRHPVFRRKSFFTGADTDRDSIGDITWYGPDLRAPEWGNRALRSLAFHIDGSEIVEDGHPADNDFFIVVHNHWDPQSFRLPAPSRGLSWRRVVDTAKKPAVLSPGKEERLAGAEYLVEGRSLVVLIGKEG